MRETFPGVSDGRGHHRQDGWMPFAGLWWADVGTQRFLMLSDGWRAGVVLNCGDTEHRKAWSGKSPSLFLEELKEGGNGGLGKLLVSLSPDFCLSHQKCHAGMCMHGYEWELHFSGSEEENVSCLLSHVLGNRSLLPHADILLMWEEEGYFENWNPWRDEVDTKSIKIQQVDCVLYYKPKLPQFL